MRANAIRSAVPIIALVLALWLPACGGGEGTAGAGTQAPAAGTTPAEAAPTARQPSEAQRGRRDAAPVDRGQVSPQSAPFRGSQGPLEHLPEYGTEADADQRAEAQAALSAYLTAAAGGDWAAACARLAPETLLQIRQLVYGAGSPPAGWCARAFPSFFSAVGHDVAELKRLEGIDVASFRVRGEAGFALLHGPDGHGLWVAMKQRDGQWKLISPIPQPL